jgi:hypothetical protein
MGKSLSGNSNGRIESFEKTLFLVGAKYPAAARKAADKPATQMAGKLRKNIDATFKNNDQLKTNTALQMEAAKIEFKVI